MIRLSRRVACFVVLALSGLSLAAAEFDLEAALRKNLGQRFWYGVYMSGQKCGYAFVEAAETKVQDRAAVSVNLEMHMKITTLGQRQDMRLTENRTYLRTGEFHSVSSQFKAGTSNVETSGTVQDGKLLVTVRTGALEKTQELPKPKSTLRDLLAVESLIGPDAKIGEQVKFAEFEPTLLKELDCVLTLKERKAIVFNGVSTQVSVLRNTIPAMGVDAEMLVDERGTMLEQTVGAMFVLRLEPEQVAKDIRYSTDLIRMGCVKLEPPPRQVPQLRTLRLQFWGIEDASLLLNDGRQQWTKQPDGSQAVAVAVPPVDPAKVAKLPVDRAQFGAELAPSVFVQSDDPRIRALAAEIVGSERDAYAAARKINRWVFKNLRKVGSAALSNAVETLASREGDCTEHTVLFVALARAAGLPARECAGLVAIERGEGLYYHAWPEVWVGQWIAIDPTLGEDLADATHIKFSQGGAEQLFRIVALFGRLKAKVLAD